MYVTNKDSPSPIATRELDQLTQNSSSAIKIIMEMPSLDNSRKTLNFVTVKKLDITVKELEATEHPILIGAIKVYQAAFALPPYEELFSQEDVLSAFQHILEKKGDLIFGTKENKVVSLAGGYPTSETVYFIDELVVAPEAQRKGYGRLTFQHLESKIEPKFRREIRTTSTNQRALNLYETSGFFRELGSVTVHHIRLNSRIELDERIYLSKPALDNKERLMMLKRVAVVYPSGNVTAVVFDKLLGLDINLRALNENIMSSWQKIRKINQSDIEQCCFVTIARDPKAVARVEMFGGEFCGNAARSVIWLITEGKDHEGLIEVSGVPGLLRFAVKNGIVSVEMPLPKGTKLVEEVEEGTLVHLDGITHLVVNSNDIDSFNSKKLLENLLEQDKYGCASLPALGVCCFEQATAKAKFSVWVRAVNTIFDETACGSGTCSIGIAMAIIEKQTKKINVIQPSGKSIRTVAEYANLSVTESFIEGVVDVLFDGEFEIKDEER